MRRRPLRVVVDIDGTLCAVTTPDGYAAAEPLPDAIRAVNDFKAAGHTVILYTGRHIDKMEVTYDWMRQHGVQFDHICFGKPVGEIYIDDLTINPTECQWSVIRQRVGDLSDRRG